MGAVALLVDADRVHENVDQNLVIYRFFKEIHGAVLERGARGIDIPVSREHHHGQLHAALAQHLLQFEAAHALHLEIGEQAATPARVVDREEVFCGGEDRRTQAFQRDEQAQGVADRRVVIDEENGVLAHGCTRSWVKGLMLFPGRPALQWAGGA